MAAGCGLGLVGRCGERVRLEGGVGPGDHVAGAEVAAGQLDRRAGGPAITPNEADGVRLEVEGCPAVRRDELVDAIDVGAADSDVEHVDVARLEQHARGPKNWSLDGSATSRVTGLQLVAALASLQKLSLVELCSHTT